MVQYHSGLQLANAVPPKPPAPQPRTDLPQHSAALSRPPCTLMPALLPCILECSAHCLTDVGFINI